MITVYNPTENAFTHNGIIPLLPTQAAVTEELNGSFELTLTHPIDPVGRWQAINEFNIIRAPTPRGLQLFRIYKVVKRLDGTLTAYARHIFYDAASDLITRVKIEGLTPDAAVKQLYAACVVSPGRFNVSSDISGAVDMDFTDVNPVHTLLDTSDGVVHRLKGELWRDNLTVKLMSAIGSDKGVQIRYRKNLTGLEFSVDAPEVATMIKPVGASGTDEQPLQLPEEFIKSPNINAYPFPMVSVVQYSDIRVGDDYTEASAHAEMRNRVAQLFADGIDLPKLSAKVEFINLGDTEEYKEYHALETVNLGDTVGIIHEGLGISVRTKVTKYTYDAILGRYTRIEIGDPPDNIARVIGNAEAAYTLVNRTAADMGARSAALAVRLDKLEEKIKGTE